MARSPFRHAGLMLTVALAFTSLMTSAAIAAGTVSVAIDGPGRVTGTVIDCTRPVGAPLPQGTCSAFIQDEIECDPDRKPPCVRLPPVETLTASPLPGTGLGFAGWTGACQGSFPVCDLLVTSNRAVQATFRDVQAPTVTFGPTVSGTIPLKAGATDNIGVQRVEFRVRGVLHATDTTAPFQTHFDTTTIADGPATFTATAFDVAGNSKPTSFDATVDN